VFNKSLGFWPNKKLVGALEHFLFSPIVGMMIQSDELIFFRGVGIPPTRHVQENKKNIFIGAIMINPVGEMVVPPGLEHMINGW